MCVGNYTHRSRGTRVIFFFISHSTIVVIYAYIYMYVCIHTHIERPFFYRIRIGTGVNYGYGPPGLSLASLSSRRRPRPEKWQGRYILNYHRVYNICLSYTAMTFIVIVSAAVLFLIGKLNSIVFK